MQHARPEHRIGRSIEQRRDQRRDALRRVLPIAVQQHHRIEVVADGVLIPELLVPTIALVLTVVEDGGPVAAIPG